MKKLFVVVGGTTYSQDDKLEIEANTEVYSNPWEYDEVGGARYPHYRAGETTWKITVAGMIVYRGIARPSRTETEDSITYTIPGPGDTQEVDVVRSARN